jgi:hypothetical protein
MKRDEILDWMRSHRDAVRGDPEKLLARAEHETRHHVTAHAWLHAKRIAEGEAESWRHRSPGSHAAEDTVASEICHDLAREMRHREPHPDGDEAALLDPETLAAFRPEARAMLHSWIGELAGEEEHRIWNEVIRFTHARAKSLVREGAISTASGWELTHFYTETAVRVAEILAHDYEEHARFGPPLR